MTKLERFDSLGEASLRLVEACKSHNPETVEQALATVYNLSCTMAIKQDISWTTVCNSTIEK